jgi:hypothetical protein
VGISHTKTVGGEFRQLPRAVHRFGIHQVRGQNFRVAVFAGVQVEHEIRQDSLQPGSQAPVHREAGAGKFGGALEIEHAQFFSQVPMRLGREIKFRRRAPAAHFNVIFRSFANRNAFVRQIGNAGENALQAGLKIGRRFLALLNLLPQILRFGDLSGRVLPSLFKLGNLLRGAVALRFHGLGFGDCLAALGVYLVEVFQYLCRIHAALAELLLDQRQVVTNEVEIKHGSSLLYRKIGGKCTLRARGTELP